jgi:isoaspartyl peptidase/L-asparaginase-like protein (Ntn-hydrolase superfamily)
MFTGSYTPISSDKIKTQKQRLNKNVDKNNHDTIGMIAIDRREYCCWKFN